MVALRVLLSTRIIFLFYQKNKRRETNLCKFSGIGTTAADRLPWAFAELALPAGSVCRVCSRPAMLYESMQACIARFLLLLTLTGGFTPFLQALSGVQPHACCLRRMHATGKHAPEIATGFTRDGNCCPSLTTS